MKQNTYFGKFATNCHMCKSDELLRVLDLGLQPHSDDFLEPKRLDDVEHFFPLRLVSCRDCGLLQIDYFVNPDILYRINYCYESSTTATGRKHYTDMAQEIVSRFNIPKGCFSVDVGSNVGVLLQGFKDAGLAVLGIDPAEIPAKKAIDNGIPTVIDYFTKEVVKHIVREKGKATVITGTNVFAHLHEIDNAAESMKALLAENGVIVIEAPHALSLIKYLEYDTIYHQHISYLSVKPMRRYFKRFGLELFEVVPQSIHGGTLRYYIGHYGAHKVAPSVVDYIQKEEDAGLYSSERLEKFAKEVVAQRRNLLGLLLYLKKEGKRIVGVSAPAKGNTLLNYCNIDTTYLDYITEKADLKIGRFTPGTRIPIYPDTKLIEEGADYALLLAWNFADEIMKNMSYFKKQGGKFIIPVPRPTIV